MRRIYVLEVVLNGKSSFRVFDEWEEWRQACKEAKDWDITSRAWELSGTRKDETYKYPEK